MSLQKRVDGIFDKSGKRMQAKFRFNFYLSPSPGNLDISSACRENLKSCKSSGLITLSYVTFDAWWHGDFQSWARNHFMASRQRQRDNKKIWKIFKVSVSR